MSNPLRFIRAAAVFAIAGSLSACDATGPDLHDQLRSQLRAQQAVWNENGAASYSVQIERRCICAGGPYDVELEVVDGEIESGVHMESGAALTSAELAEQVTLPELFDVLEDALDRLAPVVSVSYNSTVGFIQHLRIDFDQTSTSDNLEFFVEGYAPTGGV